MSPSEAAARDELLARLLAAVDSIGDENEVFIRRSAVVAAIIRESERGRPVATLPRHRSLVGLDNPAGAGDSVEASRG